MTILNTQLPQLAQALRSGKITITQVIEASFANYTASENQLNAYKTWAGVNALETAQHLDSLIKQGYDFGPLMGIPISVKDMFAVPNLPTFAGSALDLGSAWQQPGKLIQALLHQAAIITGKTHTVEFALGGLGVNNHWGTPQNPWSKDQARVPGGSSAGAGVSLCQGSALLALGTDTAGSVRIPAAMTGTVGLKTTVGRWPTDQIVPLSTSLDTPGVLAKSVTDLAYGYAAIESQLSGQEVKIPSLASCKGLRIGLVENFFWEGASNAVTQEVRRAASQLEAAGAELISLQVPMCDEVFACFQAGGLSVAELAAFLTNNLPTSYAKLDPVVRTRLEDGAAISVSEYLQRKDLLAQASLVAAQTFEQVDVWLHPTLPITAPSMAEIEQLEDYRRLNMLALRNPSIANLMGLCALSLPVGVDERGLPIAMQLTAGAQQEVKLLALAQVIEQQLGYISDLTH